MPVDFSEKSLTAVNIAYDFAVQAGAEVVLLHLIETIKHAQFEFEEPSRSVTVTVYALYDYAVEKRQALDAWAKFISKLTGKNRFESRNGIIAEVYHGHAARGR